jgi:GT2 family glycosyltransferase
LSVILVGWRRGDLIARRLAELANWSQLRPQVILVENEADQGDGQPAPALPLIHLRNVRNEGFAWAANQGLAAASGTYALFLNPDCHMEEECAQAMLAFLQNRPDCALVGPRLLDGSGRPVAAARRSFALLRPIILDLLPLRHLHLLHPNLANWSPNTAQKPQLASGVAPCLQGSALMGRREEILALAGFDSRVPLYLDDMDLCLRFQARGQLSWFLSEKTAIHTGGASVEAMANPMLSSLVASMAADVFLLKHRGWFHLILHHLILLTAAVVYLPINLLAFLMVPRRRTVLARYLVKHTWMLIYALSFFLAPKKLPDHWPKSLAAALRRARQDLPSAAQPFQLDQ